MDNGEIYLVVKVLEGSGCLVHFNDDFSYIYTAAHVLLDSEQSGTSEKSYYECDKIDVYRKVLKGRSNYVDDEKIPILEKYIHPTLDAAILKIKRIDDNNFNDSEKLLNGKKYENLRLIGFPNEFKKVGNQFDSLDIDKIDRETNDSLYVSRLKGSQKKLKELKGFSGGPIFYPEDKKLLGILSKVTHVEQQGSVDILGMETYDEILELKEISEIEPKALLIHIKNSSEVFLRVPDCKYDEIKKDVIDNDQFPKKVSSILKRFANNNILLNDDFKILGDSLLHILFPDENLRKYFCEILNKTKGLKIILRFDEKSSELACLPWEYLCFVNEKGVYEFVGSNKELILVRRLCGPEPIFKEIIVEKKLEVLIAVSESFKDEKIDQKDTVEGKFQSMILKNSENKAACEIKYCISLDDFKGKVDDGKFDIIHVNGKTRLNKEDYEISFSVDDTEWFSPEELLKCFGEKFPKIIFLHSSDEYSDLSGFAYKLANKVNSVLAIQAKSEKLNTDDFSEFIYTELGKGSFDLDNAINLSLREMGSKGAKGYGISIAFSRQAFRVEFAKNDGGGISKNLTEPIMVACKNTMSTTTNSDCNKFYYMYEEKDSITRETHYKLVEDLPECNKCNKAFKFCIKCGYLINETWIKCQKCLAPQKEIIVNNNKIDPHNPHEHDSVAENNGKRVSGSNESKSTVAGR